MGIDAALFSNDDQMFYYDREYNLELPLEYDRPLWKKWNRLTGDGLFKRKLENYLRKLIRIIKALKEEELFHKESRIAWAEEALKWTISLPDECKIVSRNDAGDEYFELYEKCDGKKDGAGAV